MKTEPGLSVQSYTSLCRENNLLFPFLSVC